MNHGLRLARELVCRSAIRITLLIERQIGNEVESSDEA